MMVILYARVSTGKQADKELSLPAQVRLMKRCAEVHGWSVAGEYQDIHTGTSLRSRPGLMAALSHARRDVRVNGLLVHKLDRLSRNTFNYLIIKGKLKASGIRILSVVETLESSPMGEFMEHIMAAQAEFYSANLSAEVKKGLEERLLRGRWNGTPPVGYLLKNGRVAFDPARAQFIRIAFERWATGTISACELATELYYQGLVGVTGKKIRASAWCRLLHNPFYKGLMKVNGKLYPGTHQPLVSVELFDHAQEIFRQKNGRGRTRRHLTFLLARKVVCPRCTSFLTGERHQKLSGKVFQYYRCHEKGCSFSIRAELLEEHVKSTVVALRLPALLLPILGKQLCKVDHKNAEQNIERIQQLRKEHQTLEGELKEVSRRYVAGILDTASHDEERARLQESIRLVEWLLVNPTEEADEKKAEHKLYEGLKNLEQTLSDNNVIRQCELIGLLITHIELRNAEPILHYTQLVRQLIQNSDASVKHEPLLAQVAPVLHA